MTTVTAANVPPWSDPSNIDHTPYPMAPVPIISGDIMLRQLANGWLISVPGSGGVAGKQYVAKDLDEVSEVLKLAVVSRTLDNAK